MTAVWAAPYIKLLQGPLYKNEGYSDALRILIQYQGEISSFFDQIGISVFIELAEGYALQNDSSILVLPESETRSMLSVYFKEKPIKQNSITNLPNI